MKATGLAQACADVPDANQSQRLATAVAAAAVVAPTTTKPVAILDTGVDANASELRGRVLPGFNAATGSTDTSDIDAHGTQVAAVAAARAGRFQGVSPTSPILPIEIYNRSSETTVAWVVRGIEEAVARGAGVINLSSSNPAADVDPKDAAVLEQAITAAFAKGTITVVSAGNEGKGDPAVPGNLTRVLTVGSATADGHARRLLELRSLGGPREPGRQPHPARPRSTSARAATASRREPRSRRPASPAPQRSSGPRAPVSMLSSCTT